MNYKMLLDKGFTPIYYNNGNLEGYILSSRLNYRLNISAERYEGVLLSIIDILGFDKYFWLQDVNSIWIQCDEDLEVIEIYFETEDRSECDAINITDTFNAIIKLLPNKFEYEMLE